MKKTTAQHILKYLNDTDWMSSVVLDRAIAHQAGKKEATVSRTCRQLSEEGKLEKKIKDRVIWYRVPDGKRKKKEIVEHLPNGSVRIKLV